MNKDDKALNGLNARLNRNLFMMPSADEAKSRSEAVDSESLEKRLRVHVQSRVDELLFQLRSQCEISMHFGGRRTVINVKPVEIKDLGIELTDDVISLLTKLLNNKGYQVMSIAPKYVGYVNGVNDNKDYRVTVSW